jgi:photosystem II stability/assembly factor-like uncharacterized protein
MLDSDRFSSRRSDEPEQRLNSTGFDFGKRRTWQQSISLLAAVLVVTVLVGVLIVVLTRAHQSSSNTAGNFSKESDALAAINMIDAQTGWAVTNKNQIVRTTDGAVHWKKVMPPYPAALGQRGAVTCFLTASNAWVAVPDATKATAVIFRTIDGGQTWQETSIQTSTVAQITFINPQDGWLLSKHAESESAETLEVFHTPDGGKTWVRIARALASSLDTPSPGRLPFSGHKAGLSFLNSSVGWVSGSIPVDGATLLYRTRDGGSIWYPQSLPLSATEKSSQLSILPPLFFTATDGILPVNFDTGKGMDLDVYVTHDGGITWSGTSPLVAAIITVDFIDVAHGWASDRVSLYMTSDGGEHWTRLPQSENFQHVTHLDFVSNDLGWAIGATASQVHTLLKTGDGGRGWVVSSYTIS